MAGLNPQAQVFNPAMTEQERNLMETPESWTEEGPLSEEELEEMEACEEWVTTLAYLEELEREHCKAMGVDEVPTKDPEQEQKQLEQQMGRWGIQGSPIQSAA